MTGSPYIPVLIPIGLSLSIMIGDYHIGSNVKLAAIVQQRSVHVLLDYYRSFLLFFHAFVYTFTDVLEFIRALDAITSI